eukprot:gnl/TRDRNA2_/TRDRNA2_37986_c0_seq1.p1 gnl/TRDRNA2_/TRDRNA2_37986_c0~~gnl/TRDRNA2_/TRDRNA2_37986_c0_seq1.p1  ORF type:complete len:311 (+),score=53.91 gnl/TRDRNA2_/TRDRNA2_37986_c0_seq1:102-1034(+)
MANILEDSFDVPAIGRQFSSQKETQPAYSFGSCSRDRALQKVFISKKHEQSKAVMNSPGPIYGLPPTVGEGRKCCFGTDAQRPSFKSQYPDSSVDLTCATVDSQNLKFHSTKGVHFGTESRSYPKNAEIYKTHPQAGMGLCSPGSTEYSPDDKIMLKNNPAYSFGPKTPRTDKKAASRNSGPAPQTPRHVGPGSHPIPSGLGSQISSARKSPPSWSFGGASQRSSSANAEARHQPVIETSPELSSLGKQVVSSARSAPSAGFGTATRDDMAKVHLVMTPADRGPMADMPRPHFKLSLPPPMLKMPPKVGM